MAWRILTPDQAAARPLGRLRGWLLLVVWAFAFAAAAALALEFAVTIDPDLSPGALAFAPGHEERIGGLAAGLVTVMLWSRWRRAIFWTLVVLWSAYLAVVGLQGFIIYVRLADAAANSAAGMEVDGWPLVFSALAWLSRHGLICAVLMGFSVALNGAPRSNMRYRRRIWVESTPSASASVPPMKPAKSSCVSITPSSFGVSPPAAPAPKR